MREAEEAHALAASWLADAMPARWVHVRGVAERAAWASSLLDVAADDLASAAWLHDIGYAPDLVASGFHPLDGARFLRSQGFDDRVVGLVAHHSYAAVEADLRGLGAVLREEFPREESLTADALCYCDMTTGPDGDRVDVLDRLAEIRARYGPGDVVTQFVDRAEPEIVATVRRVEGLLRAAQPR
jgi:HD superfamily phosphodiesterase